jgi:hypothetical protein
VISVFIVEFQTTTGPVCERYPTYEEARHRVEHFAAEALVGLPLIFQELADGSERVVRDDGKPLQWHRPTDDRPHGADDPLPLADESSGLLEEGRWRVVERRSPQLDGTEDDPLA